MAGLRERKKEQTRRRIAEVALRLFAERDFAAVTMTEIADAAEVSRATLFSYYPTKESLVLADVGAEDLAAVVTGRPAGSTPLAALRGYYRDLAAGPIAELDREATVTRLGVILASPALSAAANSLLYRQRERLAAALAEEYGERVAAIVAAEVTAAVLTIQERYFRRLVDGADPVAAGRGLADDVTLAFDLVERGAAGA